MSASVRILGGLLGWILGQVLGSGLGPALGSGLGARLGSAPRLTLLPRLQFFLPTPPFALQCIPDYIREYSSVALLEVSPFPEII